MNLTGKKTYILAGLGVVYALVRWYLGDITSDVALTTILGLLSVGALRNGVTAEVSKLNQVPVVETSADAPSDTPNGIANDLRK